MGLGSDSLPVKISLFDVDTYLADSMQFHLEYILRLFPKSGVHYLMPTFRGEAVDHRHLSQFYHSECEIEGDLHDVMNLVDRYIKFLVSEILRECRDSILFDPFCKRRSGYPIVFTEFRLSFSSLIKVDKRLFEFFIVAFNC